jgi:hypothetical protein
MTEYKFGTWYPIEELKEFDKNVLLCNYYGVLIGHKGKDEHGYFDGWYSYEDYYIMKDPSHFMPLPPRPGEGK